MSEASVPPQEQPVPPTPVGLTSEEKTLGMLCHIIAIVSHFIGPLIVWLLKKDSSRFVDENGKESLNFQLNILAYWLLCLALICVGGLFILPVIPVYMWVCVIIAGIKAYNGETFRYPFILRIIK